MNACDAIGRVEKKQTVTWYFCLIYFIQCTSACVKILNSMEINLWVWSLCLALEIATGVLNVFYQCALRGVYVYESSFYGDKDKVVHAAKRITKTHILMIIINQLRYIRILDMKQYKYLCMTEWGEKFFSIENGVYILFNVLSLTSIHIIVMLSLMSCWFFLFLIRCDSIQKQ